MTIKDKERLDDLGVAGYEIIQNPEAFCFGMDAVLLSEFVKLKEGQRVLDLGTGTGIIPILLAAKTKAEHITGMDIQEYSVDMATRSVVHNGLSSRIDIVQGDIKEASLLFGRAVFDAVTCNPPYMIDDHGLKNPADCKAIARHEILCTFADIAREAAALLKEGGNFFLIHRPFRLVEILNTLTQYKIEPKTMRFVYPFVDKEPNMVLIHGKKGARSRVTIEKPLIVYKEPGVYTEEISSIYTPKDKIPQGKLC